MKLLTPEEVLQAIKDGKPVEVKFGEHYEWKLVDRFRMNIDELLDPEHSFRSPQEVITIGDVSFPKPETQAPDLGVRYYIVDLTECKLINSFAWLNSELDYHYLNIGNLHLSEENAIAHAKALIKLSGGTYE